MGDEDMVLTCMETYSSESGYELTTRNENHVDVISVAYGTSPLGVVASVQPIDGVSSPEPVMVQ